MAQRFVKATEVGDPLHLRLKFARQRLGLKQWELAAKVSISPFQLSRIETGLVAPDAAVLDRLLTELGLEAAA